MNKIHHTHTHTHVEVHFVGYLYIIHTLIHTVKNGGQKYSVDHLCQFLILYNDDRTKVLTVNWTFIARADHIPWIFECKQNYYFTYN